jgi:hypothetical protein
MSNPITDANSIGAVSDVNTLESGGLTGSTALTGAEIIPVSQSAHLVQTTVQGIANYVMNGLAPLRQSIPVLANGQSVYVSQGYSPALIDVFVSGVRLNPSQFQATDGIHIVITDSNVLSVLTTGMTVDIAAAVAINIAGVATPASVQALIPTNQPPVNPLTGAELVSVSQGAGLFQSTLTKIAQWVIGTYQGFAQAATGAAQRTILSKLQDQVNVLDFGADPTGTNDSTVAFTNAIAALPATGGVVYLSQGSVYSCGQLPAITKPVIIATSGLGHFPAAATATIQLTGTNADHLLQFGQLPTNGSTPTMLFGCGLFGVMLTAANGATLSPFGSMVRLHGTSMFRMERVGFQSIPGRAIRLKACFEPQISDTIFRHCLNGLGASAPLQGTPPSADMSGGLTIPVITVTTSTTGGNLPAATYYYVMTALNATGESLGSIEVSIATVGNTSSNTISGTTVSGATSYKLYRGTATGTEHDVLTSNTPNFTDTSIIASEVVLIEDSYDSGGTYNVNNLRFNRGCHFEENEGTLIRSTYNSHFDICNLVDTKFEYGWPSGTFAGKTFPVFDFQSGQRITFGDGNLFNTFNAGNGYPVIFSLGNRTQNDTLGWANAIIVGQKFTQLDANTTVLKLGLTGHVSFRQNTYQDIAPGAILNQSNRPIDYEPLICTQNGSQFGLPLAGIGGPFFTSVHKLAFNNRVMAPDPGQTLNNLEGTVAVGTGASAILADLTNALGLIRDCPRGFRFDIRCRSLAGTGVLDMLVGTTTIGPQVVPSTYSCLTFFVPASAMTAAVLANASARIRIITDSTNTDTIKVDGVFISVTDGAYPGVIPGLQTVSMNPSQVSTFVIPNLATFKRGTILVQADTEGPGGYAMINSAGASGSMSAVLTGSKFTVGTTVGTDPAVNGTFNLYMNSNGDLVVHSMYASQRLVTVIPIGFG